MTASPAGQTTEERLAAALVQKRTSWDPDELREIATDLAPLVEQIAAERAATELEKFAEKWQRWVFEDALQTRGGAAYRARLDAAALRAAHQPNGGQPVHETDEAGQA